MERKMKKMCKTESNRLSSLLETELDSVKELTDELKVHRWTRTVLGDTAADKINPSQAATQALVSRKHLIYRIERMLVFWSCVLDCFDTGANTKLDAAKQADVDIRQAFRKMSKVLREHGTMVVESTSEQGDEHLVIRDDDAVRRIMKQRHTDTRNRTVVVRCLEGKLVCDHNNQL